MLKWLYGDLDKQLKIGTARDVRWSVKTIENRNHPWSVKTIDVCWRFTLNCGVRWFGKTVENRDAAPFFAKQLRFKVSIITAFVSDPILKRIGCPSSYFRSTDMLVVLLCCMMKIVEFSTGKSVGNRTPRCRRRKRYIRRRKGEHYTFLINFGMFGENETKIKENEYVLKSTMGNSLTAFE